MATFTLERVIPAPPEEVFDLSLEVDLHLDSQKTHGERVAVGRTSGRFEEGEQITWSARHFGWRFRMTSLVFDVDRPHRFRDRQVRGPFGSFLHIHEFERVGDSTLMRDIVEFRSPFGPLGMLVDVLIMRRHLIRVISNRNDAISAHFA